MTHSLELDFIKPGKKDPPFRPCARICVKTHTKDKRGYIFITGKSYGIEGLELEIKRLHEELEDIKNTARRKFNIKE